MRDAFLTRLVDAQLKKGTLDLSKAQSLYRDSGLLLNMRPRIPAHYTRDTMHRLITDAPDALLTLPEYIARYGADKADNYIPMVQNALEKEFYYHALRAPTDERGRVGMAFASRDLVYQVITDAGLEIPQRLRPLIMGADKTAGGPIEWAIPFSYVFESIEGKLNRKTHAQLSDIANDLGIKTKKSVVLFEGATDQHGNRFKLTDSVVPSTMEKIMGEKLLYEPVDIRHSNINVEGAGMSQHWLERNNPFRSGAVVVKYKKNGKIVTVKDFNDRMKIARPEGEMLTKHEIAVLEDFRRTMEVLDVTDTPLGRMYKEYGPEAMASAVEQAKGTIFDQLLLKKHTELLETKSPIVAVKAAFDSMGFESLTAWDVWRRNSGEVPAIADAYKYGDAWVKAGLVREIRNTNGDLLRYEPTPLGVLASLYQIGRRQAFYQGIPFKAIVGEAQRGMATQVRTKLNLRKFIDTMPGHANRKLTPELLERLTPEEIHQDRVKSVLLMMNDDLRARKWLSDPILAYQEAVLTHAGDIGLYPTKHAAQNAIEYYRNVWEGAYDHYGRAVSGNMPTTISPVLKRGTRLSNKAIRDIEQSVGRFVMSMDPTMFSGWVVAELESRMGFVALIEEFISEGLIRPGRQKRTIVGGEEAPMGPGEGFVPLDMERAFRGTSRKLEARPSAEEMAKAAEKGVEPKIEFQDIPAVQSLLDKYGELYGTPQAAEMLSLRLEGIKGWRSTSEKIAVESNPVAYIWNPVREANGAKLKALPEVIDRFVEVFGADAEMSKRLLKKKKDLLKKRSASQGVALAGGIVADMVDAIASVSKEINNNPLQQWYKRNALFRSTMRGTMRNLIGNGMLAVSHHPEALVSQTYWDGMSLYFSDGLVAVKEGVGGLGPSVGTRGLRKGAGTKYERGARQVEMEFYKPAPDARWTPELIEFRNEMLSRQVFGQGLTAELRDEAPLMMSNFWHQPYTKVFREHMGTTLKDLMHRKLERAKKLNPELSELQHLDVIAPSMIDEIAREFVESATLRGTSKLESLAAGANRVMTKVLGEGHFGRQAGKLAKGTVETLFNFPFNTAAGKAWEGMVKSLFLATDDMYRWSYAYYLWKKKGFSYDKIAYEVGNFMPDFTRNSPVLHAIRISNPWAFWPMKTMANFAMMTYKHPVRFNLLRHVTSYMDAYDLQSMSPEEQWAWFYRPARERSMLLRLPGGDYSFGYAFYTGDNDAMFDVSNITDVGLGHMASAAWQFLLEDEYKPRFGRPEKLPAWGDGAMTAMQQRVALAYYHIMKDVGPRLFVSPQSLLNIGSAGVEYSKYMKNNGLDTSISGDTFGKMKTYLRAVIGSLEGGSAIEKLADVAGKVDAYGSGRTTDFGGGMFRKGERYGMKRDLTFADWLASEALGADAATLDLEKVATVQEAIIKKAQKEVSIMARAEAQKRYNHDPRAMSEKDVAKKARRIMEKALNPPAPAGLLNMQIEALPMQAIRAAKDPDTRTGALINILNSLKHWGE